jgi:hypothetical protein
MAACSVSKVLDVAPDVAWGTIGGFLTISDWLPFADRTESLDGGRLRRVTARDGGTIIERLVDYDHGSMAYSYAIEQSPWPVSGYLSTLRVFPLPDSDSGCEVVWSGRFVPTTGSTDADVVSQFATIYGDGLEALAKEIGHA